MLGAVLYWKKPHYCNCTTLWQRLLLSRSTAAYGSSTYLCSQDWLDNYLKLYTGCVLFFLTFQDYNEIVTLTSEDYKIAPEGFILTVGARGPSQEEPRTVLLKRKPQGHCPASFTFK